MKVKVNTTSPMRRAEAEVAIACAWASTAPTFAEFIGRFNNLFTLREDPGERTRSNGRRLAYEYPAKKVVDHLVALGIVSADGVDVGPVYAPGDGKIERKPIFFGGVE